MIEKNEELIALIESDPRFSQFLPIHYIILHEHLIAKFLEKEKIIKVFLKTENFLCAKRKTNPKFETLLKIKISDF